MASAPRQQVIFASSSDPEHDADVILDGNQRSFWISTGLFPQSLIIELGEASTPSCVTIVSTGIKRIRIEGCDNEAPIEFTVLAEAVLENTDGLLQCNALPCCRIERPIRFMQIVMASGWDDFCTCHTIKIASETSAQTGGYVYKAKQPEAILQRCSRPSLAPATRQISLDYSSSDGGGSPRKSAPSEKSHSESKLGLDEVPLAPEERFHSEEDEVPAPKERSHSHEDEVLAPAEPVHSEEKPCDESDPEKLRAYWLDEVQLNGMRFADAPAFIRSDHEITLAAVVQNRGALEFAAPHLQAELTAVLEASFGPLNN